MAVREIVTIPDPVLRKKARKVTEVDADVRKLVLEMAETMRQAPGVGLAAPQVGISSRVIVLLSLAMKRMKTHPRNCMR
jgi:peptide deformylase